jgi:hypothetical protein
MQTLYLNNSGSRWINLDTNGKKIKLKVFFPESQIIKEYTVEYFEATGNFSLAIIRYKGKRVPLMYYKDNLYLINNEENRRFKYPGLYK